jgi:hypothetical protein
MCPTKAKDDCVQDRINDHSQRIFDLRENQGYHGGVDGGLLGSGAAQTRRQMPKFLQPT